MDETKARTSRLRTTSEREVCFVTQTQFVWSILAAQTLSQSFSIPIGHASDYRFQSVLKYMIRPYTISLSVSEFKVKITAI